MKPIRDYPLTLTGAALSVALYLFTRALDVDLFEAFVRLMESVEEYEVDEFIPPAMLLFAFAFLDQVRRRRSREVEAEKLKLYRAMLDSVHHVLNNFLNQMQLFRMTAEETPGFDPEVLALYEQTAHEASAQIDALSSIETLDESAIRASVAPRPFEERG